MIDIRVGVHFHMSEWLPVVSGNHYGCVLSPMWYIVYVNDLIVNCSCYVLKFADGKKMLS